MAEVRSALDIALERAEKIATEVLPPEPPPPRPMTMHDFMRELRKDAHPTIRAGMDRDPHRAREFAIKQIRKRRHQLHQLKANKAALGQDFPQEAADELVQCEALLLDETITRTERDRAQTVATIKGAAKPAAAAEPAKDAEAKG
jgi:hypothetical protein